LISGRTSVHSHNLQSSFVSSSTALTYPGHGIVSHETLESTSPQSSCQPCELFLLVLLDAAMWRNLTVYNRQNSLPNFSLTHLHAPGPTSTQICLFIYICTRSPARASFSCESPTQWVSRDPWQRFARAPLPHRSALTVR
jgi:hypothetical protein